MEWVIWLLAIGVLGLGALAAHGRFGEMPATITDSPPASIPSGQLSGEDVREVRFDNAVGGYSREQVDEFLDRLSKQLSTSPGSVSEPDRAPDDTVVLRRGILPGYDDRTFR